MIELRVNISGVAEDVFNEMRRLSRASDEDIVSDALSILHRAMKASQEGKRIALYAPETETVEMISLVTLPKSD